MDYENIILTEENRVGIITLNRPKALNALNSYLISELADAVTSLNKNADIGAIIIKGSEKAFAAGADIKEMQNQSFMDMFKEDIFEKIEAVEKSRKPIIAAVSGYALGGGCELVLMCDIVLATPTAKFGLPEITLGVIPGIGGTQRLIRAVGKAKAMDMVLTGRIIDVVEAEKSGIVSRIVESDKLDEEAIKTATTIANMSTTTSIIAKEALNRSFEMGLSEGCKVEKRVFQSLFATEDQKEGMSAFVDKRKANFKHK